MRGLNVIRADLSGGNDLLNLNNNSVCCGCHGNVKVTCRSFVTNVSGFVSDITLDDRNVAADRFLKKVFLAVQLNDLFALSGCR